MYYYEHFDGYDNLVQAVLDAQPVGCGGSMHSLYDLMDISNSFDDKLSDNILNDDERRSLLCLDDENPKVKLVGWILSNP